MDLIIKYFYSYIFVMGFLLCSACGSPSKSIIPSNTPTNTTIVELTSTPTAIPIPTITSSYAIASLPDTKNALIRITTQGSISEPVPSKTDFIYGTGSGFLISNSGLAVTNNHVVSGVNQITVYVGENPAQSYQAEYLAGSECYDLAVIKIEGDGFDYLDWSPESAAFGDEISLPQFRVSNQGYVFSKGIVVDTERAGDTSWSSVDSLMAYTINSDPESSGLPLLTRDGKVIGINYGNEPESNTSNGIANSLVTEMLSKLIIEQPVDTLGIDGEAYTSEDGSIIGIWIASVQTDMAAQQAGMKPGDVLTRLNQQPLAEDGTMSAYCEILRNLDPALPVEFELFRSSTGENVAGMIPGTQMGGAAQDQIVQLTPTVNPTEVAGMVFNPEASQPGEIILDYQYASSLDRWENFITNGDFDSITTQVLDGKIQVDIENIFTYSYYIYKEISLENGQLEIVVENLGGNNNNVSLVCRYSEKGWYEFNISNNGLFWIYRYNPVEEKPYIMLWSGGSRLIKTGKAENMYTATCKDNHMTLFINGSQAATINDPTIKSGKVGFAISSYNVFPISVRIDRFAVSVPE